MGASHPQSRLHRLAALDQSLSSSAAAEKRSSQQKQRQQQPTGNGSSREPLRQCGGSAPPPRSASAPSLAAAEQQQREREQQDPLYARLDSLGLASGPVGAALSLSAAVEDGSGSSGSGRRGKDGGGGRPSGLTPGLTALLEELMATHPRALDSRATIGLKVQDRSLPLDNPAAAAGGGEQRRRRPFTRRLASGAARRRLGLGDLRSTALR